MGGPIFRLSFEACSIDLSIETIILFDCNIAFGIPSYF